MKVAAKTKIVKRRIDDYVWRDEDVTNQRLRHVLKSRFFRFDDVAIVGGMVRDFARVGKRGFRSDVDLVVNAPSREVAEMANEIGARKNAFGGFSTEEHGWRVDFWALEATWAVREGYVRATSLGDFTRSTFFNHDAILYDVKKRTIICDESYLDGLQSRVIEVNLLPNPTIVGNLFRAVRRILLWELSPGPMLRSFIIDNLDEAAYREVVKLDNRKSASPMLHRFVNAAELRRAVLSKEYRRPLSTYYGEQLTLPGFAC